MSLIYVLHCDAMKLVNCDSYINLVLNRLCAVVIVVVIKPQKINAFNEYL